ncbi:MAG: beta-Ala-His dipeptidase [Muribaculaceae bacterium]|nr:beta-Ala-His dipeptidase [Muribaculaceae bacterium]
MRFLEIFKQLNHIPRPSHHEERVADFLCQFAERLGLSYDRDSQNCVVIRKAATPGHENATPVVILNHMDMVCVAEAGRSFDPLNDAIIAYEDNGWLKAEGTSLGADNGIGLSMALAILEDDSIVHGPLEVITTTNEEDGMTGASALSPDFLRGRKVINLDSEDYDTITTGAAGAYLQIHHLPLRRMAPPSDRNGWLRLTIEGGRGGHSGVDINKGRASATMLMLKLLSTLCDEVMVNVASIDAGQASASIASSATAIVCVNEDSAEQIKGREAQFNKWMHDEYGETDPNVRLTITAAEPHRNVIDNEDVKALVAALQHIPQGVVKMSESMPGTVETSNNVGRITTEESEFTVSTHTRSFVEADMIALGKEIKSIFEKNGTTSELLMEAPAWQENQHSDFLQLTSDTFNDVLGWRPRMVAMHFVFEAGFFVQKYPGIEMASIGPRIVEPHSTSERVELSTCHDIWRVTVELLRRLAQAQ